LQRFRRLASPGGIGLYALHLASGNLIGLLLLGHLFDTIGRRRMIAGTYALSYASTGAA